MHPTLTFLRALLTAPDQVSTLLPSSTYLAQAMAQQGWLVTVTVPCSKPVLVAAH